MFIDTLVVDIYIYTHIFLLVFLCCIFLCMYIYIYIYTTHLYIQLYIYKTKDNCWIWFQTSTLEGHQTLTNEHLSTKFWIQLSAYQKKQCRPKTWSNEQSGRGDKCHAVPLCRLGWAEDTYQNSKWRTFQFCFTYTWIYIYIYIYINLYICLYSNIYV